MSTTTRLWSKWKRMDMWLCNHSITNHSLGYRLLLNLYSVYGCGRSTISQHVLMRPIVSLYCTSAIFSTRQRCANQTFLIILDQSPFYFLLGWKTINLNLFGRPHIINRLSQTSVLAQSSKLLLILLSDWVSVGTMIVTETANERK